MPGCLNLTCSTPHILSLSLSVYRMCGQNSFFASCLCCICRRATPSPTSPTTLLPTASCLCCSLSLSRTFHVLSRATLYATAPTTMPYAGRGLRVLRGICRTSACLFTPHHCPAPVLACKHLPFRLHFLPPPRRCARAFCLYSYLTASLCLFACLSCCARATITAACRARLYCCYDTVDRATAHHTACLYAAYLLQHHNAFSARRTTAYSTTFIAARRAHNAVTAASAWRNGR